MEVAILFCMSQQDIESFFGRLLTDDSFRERAIAGFQQLCFEEGYRFTDEEAGIILQMELNLFGQWSQVIDPRIRRSGEGIDFWPKMGKMGWE
jgi:hypothetical protein